jgi:hypothetical protein
MSLTELLQFNYRPVVLYVIGLAVYIDAKILNSNAIASNAC